MDKVNNALCTHKAINDNTHAFLMNEGTRDAVKAWANHIEELQLAQQWYGIERVHLLVDARNAVGLPIRYLFEILSDYNRAYPDLEPPALKLAFLRSPDTVILDIYHMMAELFDPPLSIQFFIEESAAKRWLINSD